MSIFLIKIIWIIGKQKLFFPQNLKPLQLSKKI